MKLVIAGQKGEKNPKKTDMTGLNGLIFRNLKETFGLEVEILKN